MNCDAALRKFYLHFNTINVCYIYIAIVQAYNTNNLFLNLTIFHMFLLGHEQACFLIFLVSICYVS